MGANFQAVDMRWGISPAAQNTQSTIEICLSELKRCQQLSPAPNIIALVGQRYGWEPVPARITDLVFSRIAAVGSEWQQKQLHSCFRKDVNYESGAQWKLAPTREWLVDSERDLLLLLRQLSNASELDVSTAGMFFRSATHHEINQGILHSQIGGLQGSVYRRQILDLEPSQDTGFFLDDHDALPGCGKRLENLVQQLCQPGVVAVNRLYEVRRSEANMWDEYLQQFARQVNEDQQYLMLRSQDELSGTHTNSIVSEYLIRADTDRPNRVLGLDKTLQDLAAHINQCVESAAEGVLVVVTGDHGSGKTTLLRELQGRADELTPGVRIAFISSEGPWREMTLAHLARAVGEALEYQGLEAEAPSYEVVRGYLESAFESAAASGPIVIVLDALENLAWHGLARECEWLPRNLPQGCVVVAGVSDGYVAERLLSNNVPALHKELLGLDVDEARALLTNALQAEGRQLTLDQVRTLVPDGVAPLSPLWLTVVADLCRDTPSYDPIPNYPRSLDALIRHLFSELESDERHGSELVRVVLGALAASPSGLSEPEIAALVSNSRAVRQEFEERSRHPWNEDDLPTIVLSRLRMDLTPYLRERFQSGSLLLTYKSDAFRKVARRHYLNAVANQDLEIEANLVWVFAPPFEHDNWMHVQESDSADSRVLRSIEEQPKHLRRVNLLTGNAQSRLWRELDAACFLAPSRRVWCDANRKLTEAIAKSGLSWPLSDRVESALIAVIADSLRATEDSRNSWSAVSISELFARAQGYANLPEAMVAWENDGQATNSLIGLGAREFDGVYPLVTWSTLADRAAFAARLAVQAKRAQGDLGGAVQLLGSIMRQGSLNALEDWASSFGFAAFLADDVEEAGVVDAANRGNATAMFLAMHKAWVSGDEEGAKKWAGKLWDAGDLRGAEVLMNFAYDANDFQAGTRWWRLYAYIAGDVGDEARQQFVEVSQGAENVIDEWIWPAARSGNARACVHLSEYFWLNQGSPMLHEAWQARAHLIATGIDPRDTSADSETRKSLPSRIGRWMQNVWGRVGFPFRRRRRTQDSQLSSATSAPNYIELAQDLWENGERLEAMHLLEDPALAEKGSANYLLYLMMCEEGDGESAKGQGHLESAARLGVEDAMFDIGLNALDRGDKSVARSWLAAAADVGHVEALGVIPSTYYHDDPERAEVEYRKAAELGSTNAMINLGLVEADRDGDLQKALTWFQRAADLGNRDGLTMALEHTSDPQKYQRRIALMEEMAERGVPQAILALALDSAEKEDFDKALRLLDRIAHRDFPEALELRAYLLEMQGNDSKAREVMLRAAQLGDASAMANLGKMLLDDDDFDAAELWLKRAIKLNQTEAFAVLADLRLRQGKNSDAESLLAMGMGLQDAQSYFVAGSCREQEGNWEQARNLYAQAAELGSLRGLGRLGVATAVMDWTEGRPVLEQAAEQGDLESMVNLALFILRRDGNIIEAREWIKRAVSEGLPEAEDVFADQVNQLEQEAKAGDISSLTLLTWICLLDGRCAEASRLYEESLPQVDRWLAALDADDQKRSDFRSLIPTLENNAALAYVAQGNLKVGKELLAASASTGLSEAQINLAVLLKTNGEHAAGLEILKGMDSSSINTYCDEYGREAQAAQGWFRDWVADALGFVGSR